MTLNPRISSERSVVMLFHKWLLPGVLLPSRGSDWMIIVGSATAVVGGLYIQIMDTSNSSAGLVLAFAGLVTAVGGLIIPLARLLVQHLDLSGQLIATQRQLKIANERLAVLSARVDKADAQSETNKHAISRMEESGHFTVVPSQELAPDAERAGPA